MAIFYLYKHFMGFIASEANRINDHKSKQTIKNNKIEKNNKP